METHSGLISLRSLINFTPSSTTFVSLEKESLQVKNTFYLSLINGSLNIISELLGIGLPLKTSRGFYDVKKLGLDKHPFLSRYHQIHVPMLRGGAWHEGKVAIEINDLIG